MVITALITSPLLAIYNITPISLVLSDMVDSSFIKPPDDLIWFLAPVGFTTLNALVIWMLNIGLVVKQKKASFLKGKNRYITSYVLVFVMMLTIHQIMMVTRPKMPDFKRNRDLPAEAIKALRKMPGNDNMRYYPMIGLFVNNTIILIIIELMLTRNRKTQLELEKSNLEILNQQSRYDQLKQQIKPHFLFNALNTLKLLIKNQDDKAESFVLNLSKFLRSSLSYEEEKLVIRKDLEILEDFMKLQQVRFPEALGYTCDIPSEVLDTKYLPVFTLQILAENAVKHNSMVRDKPLNISITYEDGIIAFKNNLNPKVNEIESTGIGLNNLDERFQILSGSGIKVENGPYDFCVSFQVIDS